MYIVTIKNGTKKTKIQSRLRKLSSGKIVKGINTIDSFTFSLSPSNPGFDILHDFTTLVEVYNTNKNRYEFYGRVLCSTPSMSEAGLITKDVTCESYFGFLCDSQQPYVATKNWTVNELLQHIINVHNSQMEEYKRFRLGDVNVTDPNNNLYCAIQRKNTWNTIKEKLLNVLGGEIRFRVVGEAIYLDYLTRIGEEKSTEIALSKNMKSITKEKDPSEYVTRLIPLGGKLSTADGSETEERLDITSVNDGKNYIDDTEAIAEYGLHVGYVEFDDVHEPLNLLNKGRKWLEENNKVLVKYSITALDLSLIGLDVDDFDVHNYYPIKNKLLGIDDVARIIKKNIDVCEETQTTIEIGENFKTLSDIQREQYDNLKRIDADIQVIKRDYATNEILENTVTATKSLISQSEENILMSVSAGYVSTTSFDTYKNITEAKFELKVGIDDNDRIVSMLNASAEVINITSNRLTITSDNFTLSADGTVKAVNGVFENGVFNNGAFSGTMTTEGEDGFVEISNGSIKASNNTTQMKLMHGVLRWTNTLNPDGLVDFMADSGLSGHIRSRNRLSLSATNQMTLSGGGDNKLSGTWLLDSGTAVTSDRNAKNSIDDLSDSYGVLFDLLHPVTFKYNNGTSDRLHVGFIAQEVDEAVKEAGLSDKEFAGVCLTGKGTDNEQWALRYDEFIALCVKEIQKLKAQIKEIKGEER